MLLVLVSLVLAACGGGNETPTPTPIGDAVAGEALFNKPGLGCAGCHSLEVDKVVVGPSMAGVGNRAASRVPGISAEDYLRQSILEPDAFVPDGFAAGLMPGGLGEELTDDQTDDLIAYLLTLK